ncbi:Methionyl-tRNA synthetase [Emticicia oligotrophica DSM 17448]|uniref:Methionine--tRNA ligase n=1 Tax=Emticicia oligotrophica (strain DSM 17448 / CIP 109782 / MTCC 6937 / GPTSA100-15) TaxID=929562 RepID=A0ABN4AKT1_EMTOG|nr:methionine--tRNA ligase [Emticicia oligotrophica]AFK02908.1 Methionyl-tRNA synthetase [Emticicia oligotrophica DSM 17448]
MTETQQKYTVTAALIYANGPIHIGHLAGCYIPADIYVRYLRSKGADVAFISGTDEHGVPITVKARKEGKTPQQVVDFYYEQIKKSFTDFGISFDIYSRTSNQSHHKVSQEIFTTMYNKGYFDEEVSEQYFDEVAQQFLADRYIVGECPTCANPNAYGDQCEKCGSTLSPTELKNPRSTLSGSKPVMKSTKNWYLPLDRMQPEIEKYVNSHKEWKTNVFGQCQSWLKDGLRPRAMTRDLDWGISVPLPDTDGKVLYVWFDAPIGYITFTQEWAAQNGKNWEDYWKNEDTKLVHFIGKDNIVFHCIIFPAMLMAEGSYILPDNVPAQEFMNLEGDKISTSRNWAVWLHEYLEEFPNKQDVLRYALSANMPESKDNDFTWKDFQTKNNSELVAIYGNFVNRAVVLTHKFFEGKVPARGELTDYDKETLATLAEFPSKIGDSVENYRFREALANMMDLARLGNKYLAETEPWKVIKEDPARVETIMNIALQIAANLAILSEPFLPFTSEKLRTQLGVSSVTWSEAGGADLLATGTQIGEASLLFEKIEDDVIEKQVKKLQESKRLNELENMKVPALKENIQFDDFAKLDIRIGTILEAEKLPKSDKLLKFLIDDGFEKRIILSGIAKHYSPEEMIGKQVTFIANLAPRKMMGIESNGMILMAEDRDGSLALLQPNKKVWNGGTVS